MYGNSRYFIEIIKIFVILQIDNSYIIIKNLAGILLNHNNTNPPPPHVDQIKDVNCIYRPFSQIGVRIMDLNHISRKSV